MTKTIDVVLYFADWCHYCQIMKPQWNKFKENIKNKQNGIVIRTAEYEHSTLEKNGGGKINGNAIDGYPTIKIKLEYNGDKKEYNYDDYIKKKEAKLMTKFVNEIAKIMSKN